MLDSSFDSMPASSQPTPPLHQPAADSFLNSATPTAGLPPAANALTLKPATSAKARMHFFMYFLPLIPPVDRSPPGTAMPARCLVSVAPPGRRHDRDAAALAIHRTF